MAITLRTAREIELLRKAGAVVASVLSKLQQEVRPGISTAELDRIAQRLTLAEHAVPLFKGVRSSYAKQPFPSAICASVNEQVVHGIPLDTVILHSGDVLSVDFGARLAGYCGDAALTIGVGNIAPERQKLIDIVRRMLDIAIAKAAPGVLWSSIAGLMQKCAESAGFSVVRDLCGHGIGTAMHEDPRLPNFVSKELLADDICLQEGMILAVEPMINIGTYAVRTLSDGWTVVTKDGKYSAHWEHTIAIVGSGCEVLTA